MIDEQNNKVESTPTQEVTPAAPKPAKKKKGAKIAIILTASLAVLIGAAVGTNYALYETGIINPVRGAADNGAVAVQDILNPDGSGVLEIPGELNGKPVTMIESGAFANRKGIFEIVLPETISAISSRAFYRCSDLKKINIPSSVQSIAPDAFDGCPDLIVEASLSYNEWKKLYKGSLADSHVHCNSYDVYANGMLNCNVGYGETLSMRAESFVGYSFNSWVLRESNGDGEKTVTSSYLYILFEFHSNLYVSTQYGANKYNIYFDDDYGTSSNTSVSVYYDHYAPIVEAPKKKGHTFLGYYFDGFQIFDNRGIPTMAHTFASDLHVTAMWSTNSYTATFITNGGSSVSSKTVFYGNSLSMPSTSRTGYNFSAWTLDGSTVGSSYRWNRDEDLVFEANWTPRTYTITIDANGGVCSYTRVGTTYDKKYVMPTATRTGYTFIEWLDNSTFEHVNEQGIWQNTSNKTYVAQWSANSYLVSFVSNGGSVVPDLTVTYDSTYTFANPVRTGYTFNGWFEDETLLTPIESEAIWQIPHDQTVYAKWTPNVYTLHLVTNNGVLPDGFDNDIDVTFDAGYVVPTPTRYGYTFDGWYREDTFENLYSQTSLWDVASDVTIYAKWIANISTLTFHSNGGTSVGSKDVTFDQPYTLEEPARYGYTFEGWFLDDGFAEGLPTTGTWSIDQSSIELYARWEPVGTDVVLNNVDLSDFSESVSTSMHMTFDEGYSLPTPSRVGYTFEGWFLDALYTSPIASNGVWERIEDSLNLYAEWTAHVTSLSFVSNGGTIVDDTSVTFGSDYSLSSPTKTGYTFDGWFLEEEFENRISSTGIWDHDVTSMTLYAHWMQMGTRAYLQNVTSADFSETVDLEPYFLYGESYSLPTPSRNGYDFDCWCIDSALTSPISSSGTWTREESSLAIYAKWVAHVSEITFDSNGASPIPTTSISFGASYDLPIPPRLGYSFDGWFANIDGASVPIASSGVWDIDESEVLLLAQWSVRHTTVTLTNLSGSDDQVEYVYGESYSLPTPTRTGYTFAGWTCTSPFTGDVALSGTWLNDYDEMTLVANWTANAYVLHADVGFGNIDGNTGVIDIPVVFGSAYSLPNPKGVGIKFTGWTDHATGEVFIPSTEWESDGDLYIDANWEMAGGSDISFTESGDSSYSDIHLDYGESYTLPTPTRSGYSFDGWYLGDVLVPTSGEWAYEEAVTLVGHWTCLPTVTVSSPYTYGFTYNSSTDYWVSNNKGVHSSVAYARITIECAADFTLSVEYISYGESGYDFGLFSYLDTSLPTTYSDTTTNVKYSAKGYSSSSMKTLSYGTVSAGSHYITISYRKDGSANSGTDTLSFRIIAAPIS